MRYRVTTGCYALPHAIYRQYLYFFLSKFVGICAFVLCDEQSSGDMDITDYRREAVHIQKRRSVALGSREDVPTP